MSIKSAILVFFQILVMVYLVVINNPFTNGFGIMIQIVGILIGLWGIFNIRVGNFNIQPEVKSDSLIKSGPYKWIRNPMYSGVLLFYFPIIIHNISYLNSLVFLILVITLFYKIDAEEQFLEDKFGSEYLEYKKITKRLLPFIY